MSSLKTGLLAGFCLIAIYLFVSAPPPLEVAGGASGTARQIEVRRLFDTLDAINGAARMLYTSRIVGAGLQAGLKFGEDWAEPGVEKGPLPALFLRLVAARLETKPPRLGLYLGSDQPINASNLFTGPQALTFLAVKADRAAHFTTADGIGQIGLYPDFAAAQPCVSCHNGHKSSPKTDWNLGDVMGATTWTYPDADVAADDYLATTEALFQAIDESYRGYLAKVEGFAKPPIVGTVWPEPGLNVLPSAEVFMAELRRLTAETVLVNLVLRQGEQP